MPTVELACQYAVPPIGHGTRRSGQRENISSARYNGTGTRLDGRRADLLERQPAEKLAKAGNFLAAHVGKRFGRNIATGDARSACRDNAIDASVIDPAVQACNHGVSVIVHNATISERVARRRQQLDQFVTRAVVRCCACVRHGQNSDPDGLKFSRFVDQRETRTALAPDRPGKRGHNP